MAGVKKDELRRVLGQVVSYDGGNKVGTISSVIGDGIRDIPVVDATGGGVTVDSDDSGGCIFAGGGARTIVLPVPAGQAAPRLRGQDPRARDRAPRAHRP